MSRRIISTTEATITRRLGAPEIKRIGAGTIAIWPKGSDGSDPYLVLHTSPGREQLSAEYVGLRKCWTLAGNAFPDAPLATVELALAEAIVWMDSHRIGGGNRPRPNGRGFPRKDN